MIPNYLILGGKSIEDLQKKINEYSKKENGEYKPISITVDPINVEVHFLALLGARSKS